MDSDRDAKRTIEKRTKTNNRKQRENNRKAIVGYTSFPSATQASRKLDKLSKGLDNIPEVAGNKKIRRAGGPPKMYSQNTHNEKPAKTIAKPMKYKTNREHKLTQ